MNQNFSIIIPIFNEKKNIKKLINKIIKSLSKIKLKYEVIFIDDNSYDGSKEILKNIKKRNIHFYIRNKTRDLSQSCILGFDKSKYNNIIVMDGDLQHDPRYLPIIIKIFFKKNYDFVICSRDFFKLILKKKKFFIKFRSFLSLILNQMFNIFVVRGVKDPMSGYFMFKKNIYTKNKKKLFGKGFKILVDLLVSSSKELKIYNLKIIFKERKDAKSKLNFKILFLIIRFAFQHLVFFRKVTKQK